MINRNLINFFGISGTVEIENSNFANVEFLFVHFLSIRDQVSKISVVLDLIKQHFFAYSFVYKFLVSARFKNPDFKN